MRIRSRLFACLTLTLGAFAAPAVAEADPRFAEVGGGNTEPCAISDPCDIFTAVEDASTGDDVTLLGGIPPDPHYVIASSLSVPSGVTVHGAPGARPRIQGTFVGNSAVAVPASAVIRDVSIDHFDPNNGAVFTNGGTIERVRARSAGGGCIANPGSLIRDSVCWTPDGGSRAGFTAQGPFSGTVTLRNVTAVGTGGTTPGLGAFVFSSDATLEVNATNVIARSAGGPDVTGQGQPCCTGEVVNINLDHSNYDSKVEDDSSGTVTITDPGVDDNETLEPVLVGPLAGDFSQAPTSAGTLNLGIAGTVNGFGLGAFDLDGQARDQGGAPDIGADEFPAPPAPTGLSFTPGGGTENNPKLSGSSAGATSYDVYPNGTCTPPAVAAAVAPAVFEGDGVSLNVPDGTTRTFSARATGPGGASACSTPISYTETTTPPPTGGSPTGGPTGQRAAALKKCAKIKKKAKKRKCKKRARKLPV